MWKTFAVLGMTVSTAFAQQENATAYEALRVISGQLGKPALNHVISITGEDGDPQPQKWKVLLEDSQSPTGTREVVVANGSVVSDRTPERVVIGSASNSTIKTSRLNLDSSGAFAVASRTADKSSAKFASANYTLRVDEKGDPVWIITLMSPSRRPVGTIHINCNRGNVVRTEGMFAGATMEDVAVDPGYQHEAPRHEVARREESSGSDEVDEDGDPRGPFYPVKRSIKNGFFRAQDEAKGMWGRVRRSFDDYISRH